MAVWVWRKVRPVKVESSVTVRICKADLLNTVCAHAAHKTTNVCGKTRWTLWQHAQRIVKSVWWDLCIALLLFYTDRCEQKRLFGEKQKFHAVRLHACRPEQERVVAYIRNITTTLCRTLKRSIKCRQIITAKKPNKKVKKKSNLALQIKPITAWYYELSTEEYSQFVCRSGATQNWWPNWMEVTWKSLLTPKKVCAAEMTHIPSSNLCQPSRGGKHFQIWRNDEDSIEGNISLVCF